MKKRTAFLGIIILMLSLTTLGQTKENSPTRDKNSQTQVDLQRAIKLDKDSKTEEVTITIKPNTQRFQIVISSLVSNGKLTIELYDPKGTKQGNFTVGTQLTSSKQEKVQGNIRKSLKEPQAGQWKVKIIPDGATGDIRIQTGVIE